MSAVYVADGAIVCALGASLDELWPRIIEGHSAIDPVRGFSTEAFGCHSAACISSLNRGTEPNRVCALMGTALDQLRPVPTETFVIWAGVKGNAEYVEALAAAGEVPDIYLPCQHRRWVCTKLGIEDRGMEVNAACASSTVGLAVAAQMIARGEHPAVLVCAADTVSHFTFAGFAALGALSPTTCRPFDVKRDGLSLGDGAVVILLASAEVVAKHGYSPLARLTGWGIANDANHITGPSRDGTGLATAIRMALLRAGLSQDGVEALCAHGTGTAYNDAMELRAIESVFGGRVLPVFSVKGAIGHTLGAAGGIEAAICLKALANRTVPATSGLATPEPLAVGRAAGTPQAFAGDNIVTVNSGFGGVNAALVFEAGLEDSPHEGHEPHRRAHKRSRICVDVRQEDFQVAVTGGGWIAANSYGRLRDRTVPVLGPGRAEIPPPDEIFERRPNRYGRFDTYTKLGCSAVSLALVDARLRDGNDVCPSGVVSSSRRECLVTDSVYYETARCDGGALASPNLFSYTLPCIMQGECALSFKLTGPTLCVGEAGGRGIAALRTAMRLMADRLTPVMIAGWLDGPVGDMPVALDADGDDLPGAVFVVLESRPRASAGAVRWIRCTRDSVILDGVRGIASILELFGEAPSRQ
ncbi:MAG: beta-ketoacyl synthase N-terminal-like domain-containing protein [Phycisphaerae bacterium]